MFRFLPICSAVLAARLPHSGQKQLWTDSTDLSLIRASALPCLYSFGSLDYFVYNILHLMALREIFLNPFDQKSNFLLGVQT